MNTPQDAQGALSAIGDPTRIEGLVKEALECGARLGVLQAARYCRMSGRADLADRLISIHREIAALSLTKSTDAAGTSDD